MIVDLEWVMEVLALGVSSDDFQILLVGCGDNIQVF